MAYSIQQWERARAYYTAGLSLREIEAKTGINNSSIQKKAKNQQWKHGSNADYIEAKTIIAEKKSAENSAVVEILDEIADEAIRHKRLINNNAELIASQIPKLIKGMSEQKINEDTGEVYEVSSITPSDIKLLAEANDKLAVTLKVADRHAKGGDINVNATAGAIANAQAKTIDDFYEEQ